MSKELIERLHKHRPGKGDLDDEAADRIEQLEAEVAAIKAEAAHWKSNHATEVRRARILKERTDMPIERVDAYEQWGKDQMALKEAQEAAEFNFQQYQDAGRLLCEARAEIEQWKANSQENKLIAEQMAEPYKREIAASQAREQQLREALTCCVCAMQDYQAGIGITELFDKGERLGRLVLLSEKQDTTALEAMIQKAGEVMRERTTNNIANTDWLFANASDQKAARYNISYQARALQAKNIRALPGVTLEDLK